MSDRVPPPRQGPPLPGAPLPPRPVPAWPETNSPNWPGSTNRAASGSTNPPPAPAAWGPPDVDPAVQPPGAHTPPLGPSVPPAGLGAAPPPGPAGWDPQPGYPPPGYPPYPPEGGPGDGFDGTFGAGRQEPDVADWWQRLVARFIDGVGFLVVQSVLSTVCYALFGPSFGFDETGFRVTGSWILPAVLSGVLSGLLFAAYDVIMHVRFGATAGKMLLRLKLAGVDRRPASQAAIVTRALAYPGVFAVLGLVAGLSLSAFGLGSMPLALVTLADGVFVLVDQVRRQALHDRLAKTVVLKTPASPTLS